mmetsp:Transcript_2528/g.5495  ORF Transcript_2528/g.5495 Transcript_2528/m.5495 type:complete len:202 (+) Transcript_2528:2499-3104(+)
MGGETLPGIHGHLLLSLGVLGIIIDIHESHFPLKTILFHDLVRVQWHALEGIDGDENGSGGGVNDIRIVTQPQCMQNGRFVKVRQSDKIVDSPDHLIRGIDIANLNVIQLISFGRFDVYREHYFERFDVSVIAISPRYFIGSMHVRIEKRTEALGAASRLRIGGAHVGRAGIVAQRDLEDGDALDDHLFAIVNEGGDPSPP